MKRTIQLTTCFLLFALMLGACRSDEPDPVVQNERVATRIVQEGGTVADPADPTPISSEPKPTPTAMPTASPTPLPAKELVVCMAAEPESLYLYSDASVALDAGAATAIWHGIYENLYTTLSYNYQAQGLEKLPNLADGDAVINTVVVNQGDTIANASGDVVTLSPGVQLLNAEGALVTYNGEGPVQMQQMVVDFTFKPLVWSDGTPVTAEDSVFSYRVAADIATPGDKSKIERTASYEATGDLSVRWTSIPGYKDPTYFTNVWLPLPQHQLSNFSPAELLEAEAANQTPLSYGPFMVKSWSAGEHIILVANPHYYRAAEGLPRVDQVMFKFIPDAAAQADWLQRDGCEVATRDTLAAHLPLLLSEPALSPRGGAKLPLVPHVQTSSIFEHIDFGINSIDDYAETRPDWFEDVRVRQAITLCTNRQRMVDELMFGRSEIMHAYIPDGHPLYPENAAAYPYDPAAANALLDEAGYMDRDGNGIREDIETTTPFSVTLGTDSESAMRLQLTQIFQENMRDCGIVVELYDLPAGVWYADGPFSPLFGRRFDLAQFAWLTDLRPPCNLYLSENITGPEEQGFGGWGNVNASGWANEAFDAACRAALLALPDTVEYEQNHKEAVRIFSEQVPMIPLFAQLKVAAARPEVLNFKVDPTQPSELWNLYELDLEDGAAKRDLERKSQVFSCRPG
ncbi:MAG TPA: ABC transporter substrate-binding protein [Anaerolineae bacterium]